MENNFQIDLSSEEIFVLAGLLNYESVFGVKDNLNINDGIDIKKLVADTFLVLERRKLLHYDLDGTLYIIPNLKIAIECICKSEIVGLFKTNLNAGRKTTVYVLENENIVVLLEENKNNQYRVCISENFSIEGVLPKEILTAKYSELNEKMLFETAKMVKKQIAAFDYTSALNIVQENVIDPSSAEVITQILSGNCGYLSVQIYKKESVLHKAIYNELVSVSNNQIVLVKSNENDELKFTSIESNTFINGIQSCLSF